MVGNEESRETIYDIYFGQDSSSTKQAVAWGTDGQFYWGGVCLSHSEISRLRSTDIS